MSRCKDAILEFSERYWPCEFKNDRGACRSTRAIHTTGHRYENGRILAGGNYQSSFYPDKASDLFLEQLQMHTQRIEDMIDQKQHDQTSSFRYIDVVCSIHLEETRRFYLSLGSASLFISHDVCLSCLKDEPKHALPCGHRLCHACVMSFGREIAPALVEMSGCPLLAEKQWKRAWQIDMEPRRAGARVLCLDGQVSHPNLKFLRDPGLLTHCLRT